MTGCEGRAEEFPQEAVNTSGKRRDRGKSGCRGRREVPTRARRRERREEEALMSPLQYVWIARDSRDPVAGTPPVGAALGELEAALAAHRVSLRRAEAISQAPAGEPRVVVAGVDGGVARALLDAAGASLPAGPE